MNKNKYEIINSRMLNADNLISNSFPKTLKLEEAKKALEYMTRYLQSEGFKLRLLNVNNTYMKQFLESLYDKHSGKMLNDRWVTFEGLNNSLSDILDVSGSWEMLDNGEYKKTNTGGTVKLGDINFNGYVNNGYDEVAAHEITHAIDDAFKIWMNENGHADWLKDQEDRITKYSELFPIFRESKAYKELATRLGLQHAYTFHLNISLYYDESHDAMPSESYADLGLLRYELDKYGIYDSTLKNNPVNQKHIDAYRKAVEGKSINRLFNNFTDELIIEMLNTIAYNNNNNNNFDMYNLPRNVLYAKNGTTITLYFKNGRKNWVTNGTKESPKFKYYYKK